MSIAAAGVRGAHPLMALDRLDDLVADRVGRIERGHRLLEDHGEPRTAQVAQLGRRDLQEVAALELDLAADRRVLRRQQPHDGERGHALAASRLADQAERAAALQGKVDAVDGTDGAVVGRETDGQLPELQQRFGHSAALARAAWLLSTSASIRARS
jgi:hypothetical protein